MKSSGQATPVVTASLSLVPLIRFFSFVICSFSELVAQALHLKLLLVLWMSYRGFLNNFSHAKQMANALLLLDMSRVLGSELKISQQRNFNTLASAGL